MDVNSGSVTSDGNGARVGAGGRMGTGRVDRDPAVSQKPKIIADRIEELVNLHRIAKSASETLTEAVEKAAQDSGYKPAVVKKLVTAKAGDKFEEKHREVEQQAELFDEVGG